LGSRSKQAASSTGMDPPESPAVPSATDITAALLLGDDEVMSPRELARRKPLLSTETEDEEVAVTDDEQEKEGDDESSGYIPDWLASFVQQADTTLQEAQREFDLFATPNERMQHAAHRSTTATNIDDDSACSRTTLENRQQQQKQQLDSNNDSNISQDLTPNRNIKAAKPNQSYQKAQDNEPSYLDTPHHIVSLEKVVSEEEQEQQEQQQQQHPYSELDLMDLDPVFESHLSSEVRPSMSCPSYSDQSEFTDYHRPQSFTKSSSLDRLSVLSATNKPNLIQSHINDHFPHSFSHVQDTNNNNNDKNNNNDNDNNNNSHQQQQHHTISNWGMETPPSRSKRQQQEQQQQQQQQPDPPGSLSRRMDLLLAASPDVRQSPQPNPVNTMTNSEVKRVALGDDFENYSSDYASSSHNNDPISKLHRAMFFRRDSSSRDTDSANDPEIGLK
jgi:hypothetical protein